MRSAIYTGHVSHRRYAPKQHALRYRVYSLLLDIDELDQLDRDLRWFSVDRFNVLSFRRRDHGPRGSALRPWAQRLLASEGVEIGSGRIQLLVYPRILGYGFDPLTVWYCHDESGRLAGVIHEVRNTFGEYHCYVASVERIDEALAAHTAEKAFHVSPFFDVAGTYDFRLRPPGRSVSVVIDYSNDDQLLLSASFSGVRSALTDRNLSSRFWSHPLVTFKVIAGIHWEALKLFRKRVGFRSKPEPPTTNVTYAAESKEGVR